MPTVVPLTSREIALLVSLALIAVFYVYFRVWFSAYRRRVEAVLGRRDAAETRTKAGFESFLAEAQADLRERAPRWIGSSPLRTEKGLVKLCTILARYRGPSPIPETSGKFAPQGKLKPSAVFVAVCLTILVAGVACGIAVTLRVLMLYGIDIMFHESVLRGAYMVTIGVMCWMVFFEATVDLSLNRHLVRHAGTYAVVMCLLCVALPFIAYAFGLR